MQIHLDISRYERLRYQAIDILRYYNVHDHSMVTITQLLHSSTIRNCFHAVRNAGALKLHLQKYPGIKLQ